jgi:hypothetical protein
MEIIEAGAHMYFIWFKIKMSLIILIFFNGFIVGRGVTLRLQKLIDPNQQKKYSEAEIEKLKDNTHIFQYTKILIYMLIIIMAAFRFN